MDNLAKDFFNNIKKSTIEYNNLEDVLFSNEHMSNFNEQLHVALFVVNHIIKSRLEARMKPSNESLQQGYKNNIKQNTPNRWELVPPNFVDLKSKSAKLAFLIVCCKSKFNPKTVAEYTNFIDSFQSVNEVILYISGSRLSVDNKPLPEDSTKSLVSALLRLSDYEKDIYFSKTAYNINREIYMDRIQKMNLNQVSPFTPLISEYISGCVPKLDQFNEKKKRIDQLSVDRKGSVAAMIRELDEKIPKKRRSKFIDDAEYEFFVGDLHFPNDLVAHNGMSETTYYYKGCVFDVINQTNMSLPWSERLKSTTDPKIELSKATGREICEIATNKSATIAVSHKQNGEYIKEFMTIRRKTLGS